MVKTNSVTIIITKKGINWNTYYQTTMYILTYVGELAFIKSYLHFNSCNIKAFSGDITSLIIIMMLSIIMNGISYLVKRLRSW